MRFPSVLLTLLAALALAGGLVHAAAATAQPAPPAADGPRTPLPKRDWVVYSTEIGWLRVGPLAEFDAKWKKKDEIWGGTSEEPLKKYLVRKGYASREEALEAVCNFLTRVQLRIEPPLRGQPVRYFTGMLDGKEYFLRLTPGFSREAVEDMAAGRFFKGLEYDFAAERAVLAKYHLTPRHVFGRKQWLVHSISFSTTEGPKAEDRWTCVSSRPEKNERGEWYVVLADGYGGTRTYGLREVEGPFRENYTLARVLKRYGVKEVDLWPPVTSAAGFEVQPRVAAEDGPPNAKDYGDRALPRQAIVPNAALEDWVIYAVEGNWLHVGTRYEYEQPLLKREVIWGGTGDQPAAKKLLAPPPGKKLYSRRQALIALCSELRNVSTEFAPLAQPREVITGEYGGAAYRLRIDRGPDGDETPEYKTLAYDYGDVAATLAQFKVAPLRRFGKMRLVHATGHGTISGGVKDDLWMLAPAGAVSADGKGMTLPDGLGGTFGYSIDYAGPPVSDNYAISALQTQIIGGNAALKSKLGFLGVWAEDRGVRAGEAPPGFSPNGSPPEATRVTVARVLPAEVPRGKSVGVTLLATGITPGCALDFGAGIQATGLANGGRDADTPHEVWHCTVEVAEDAALGLRSVQARNPDGGSGSGPAFQVVEQESAGTEFPPLPMIVPRGEQEGRLKDELLAHKGRYQERLNAAIDAAAKQPSFTSSKPADTEAFLAAWMAGKEKALKPEAEAREAAVAFFETLALCYDRLSPEERAAVEAGLSKRAFALRNYRTAQRVLVREKSGLGAYFSIEDLNGYYGGLERATWAALELDALVKMWLRVNQARVLLHGSYNVYHAEIPERAAGIQAARGEHFRALVDTGIAGILASESQYEAQLDARKDRLYTLKEWWKETGEIFNDPLVSRRLAGGAIQLFALGFNFFDLAAGLGADALKGGIYYIFGPDFRTRAEKLEDQAVQNWEKTNRKLLALRLLREKPLSEVRPLAETAARDVTTILPVAPGKIDAEDLKYLFEDRAFVDATDGGLLRILSVALTDFPTRCGIELVIAKERIRLLHRDERAAMRQEMGQDPETGETAWGTLLSPTAWADARSKGALRRADYAERGADISRKEGHMAACDRLLDALPDLDFAFERLPEALLLDHTRLLAQSVSYSLFWVRVREEDTARALAEMDRSLGDLTRKPEAAAAVTREQENLVNATRALRAAEEVRIRELIYRDFVYAWDLSGALAHADALRKDPEWAARAALLRDAIAAERVKKAGIQLFRNVGDVALVMAGVGLASRVVCVVRSGGVTLSLAEAASAGHLSFARYAYGVFNPLVHGPWEIFEESLSEVAGDIAVKMAGPDYEEVIRRVVELLVEQIRGEEKQQIVDANMEALKQKIAARLRQEAARNPHLDPNRADAAVRTQEILKLAETFAREQERARQAANPEVRASILRQAADMALSCARVLQIGVIEQVCRKIRNALTGTDPDAAAAKRHAEAEAAARRWGRPPTVAWLEQLFREDPASFFAPGSRFDIETLRKDLKLLEETVRPEERGRLEALKQKLDQERLDRFARAMSRFLAAHAGSIRGVILNGTAPGNPEYKGIYSDKDFTLVAKDPADAPRLRQAVREAFQAEGIQLNEKGAWASADMEVMVQEFLPGDVPPIRSMKDFAEWARRYLKDAETRYLTAGGSMWVGLYNYLNGGTLTFQNGKAITDPVANPALLPAVIMHPMFAHGLVLDAARFDKLIDPRSLSTKELAEMAGARAKNVLRAVDALIWAVRPDLIAARTPAEAKRLGYHALVVQDARALCRHGLITEEQLRLVETLAHMKTGVKTLDALGLDPKNGDLNRGTLEHLWVQMNGMMRRAYEGTRPVYLRWMSDIGSGRVIDPQLKEVLSAVAFRNHSAAKLIPRDKLALLSGQTDAQVLEQENRLALDFLPPPDPAAPSAAETEAAARPFPEGDSGDRRTHEQDGGPRVQHQDVAPAPAGPAPTLQSILAPFDAALRAEMQAKIRGTDEFYSDRSKNPAGFVKGGETWTGTEVASDIAASELAKLTGTHVPHTERVRFPKTERDGTVVQVDASVQTWVPGDSLAAILEGRDIHRPERGEIKPPANLTREQLIERTREQFLKDKLLSALLGDEDRRAANYMVTPEGDLVAIDHSNAVHLEELGSDPAANRARVKAEMKRRLQGLNNTPAGARNRYDEINKLYDPRYEDLQALWSVMEAKLTDAELARVAANYGADAQNVQKAWRLRREVMLEVMAELYPKRDGTFAPPPKAAAPKPGAKPGPKPAPRGSAPSRGSRSPRPFPGRAGRRAPAPTTAGGPPCALV